MKKIIILLALIGGCEKRQKYVTVEESLVDHKSVNLSVTFTLNRDVNHVGKSTLKNILKEELINSSVRINKQLGNHGLPQGKLTIIE